MYVKKNLAKKIKQGKIMENQMGGGESLNDKLWKIKELADYLMVSEKWVENKIHDGKITAIHLDGIRRIAQDEVDRISKNGFLKG